MTQAAPQTPDPWKSFRGVIAGTLILEVITVLLALPVGVRGRRRPDAVVHGLFARLLGAVGAARRGVQGKLWAIWANLSAQLLLVLGFFVYPAIGFMGVIFGVVWGVIAYLRYRVRQQQRSRLLPGQQPPADGPVR